MISIQKPSYNAIQEFRAAQAKLDLTYAAIGATAAIPPAGYVVDRTRVKLGNGAAVFAVACDALRTWQHFQLGWVEAQPRETPLQPGEVIAVMGHAVGLWWLNACRIVYVIEETGPFTRFGFAYGTLPGHAESGEERFLLEWNHADESVWYDILAFSRPNYWSARLGYFWVRRLQKRFARDSCRVMQAAVR